MDTDRYDDLLLALEEERLHEEHFYTQLASEKTKKEKVEAGIMLAGLDLESKYYTIGEYVELKFRRTDTTMPHKFRVGAGCNLLFSKGGEEKVLRATVSFLKRSILGIIIKDDVIQKESLSDMAVYSLELIYDERPYRVMRDAINTLQKTDNQFLIDLREGVRNKSVLNAETIDNPAKWSIPNHLNTRQTETVQSLLQAGQMGIIHGPPGTGKTTTIVAFIQTLIQKEKQILVCAPSNNAVDLLAKKLDEKGIKVLRIGNVTRIDDDVAHLSLDEQARNHADWNHIKKVKIEAEEAIRMASGYKRKFGSEERRQRNEMYKEAKALRKWARDLQERLTAQIVDDAQVVATTLIGCSSREMEDMHFTTCIIDEASQALEPESWNAIIRADRVIFAGDHLQLPPTVKSTKAVKMGLSTTLLDRMTDHIKFSSLLNTQYRMNDSILSFSNQEFYGGALQSAEENASHTLSADAPPLIFIDTSGCGFNEQRNKKSRSLRNEGEMFIVREHFLQQAELYKGFSIGIISPYAEQVKYIRDQVAEDEIFREYDITANTIDGFQGQEKDIIILSLVRSNDMGEIGFLKDSRRLNVAMTRARKQLVLIGDGATLSHEELYRKVMDHIEANGKYMSGWEFMA